MPRERRVFSRGRSFPRHLADLKLRHFGKRALNQHSMAKLIRRSDAKLIEHLHSASPSAKSASAYGFATIPSNTVCASRIKSLPAAIDSLSAPSGRADPQKLGHLFDSFLQDEPTTTFSFKIRSRPQKDQHREGELTFAQICAQCFCRSLSRCRRDRGNRHKFDRPCRFGSRNS